MPTGDIEESRPSRPLSGLAVAWREPWIWVGIAVVYGALTSWLPAPSDASFWMSNLSAPYLLFPFLAGASAARSWRGAMLLGVLVDWALVAAFYARSLYDPAQIANNHRQGEPAISLNQVVDWAAIQANGPWLKLSIAAGLAFGLLGMWWARDRSVLGAVAMTTPFIVEPFAWRAYEGRWSMSAGLWATETAVGVALLGLLLLRARAGTRACAGR